MSRLLAFGRFFVFLGMVIASRRLVQCLGQCGKRSPTANAVRGKSLIAMSALLKILNCHDAF